MKLGELQAKGTKMHGGQKPEQESSQQMPSFLRFLLEYLTGSEAWSLKRESDEIKARGDESSRKTAEALARADSSSFNTQTFLRTLAEENQKVQTTLKGTPAPHLPEPGDRS